MKLRGVNLGGWLVLEKWITPSLFNGLQAVDETTFCLEVGDRKEQMLREHWKSLITQEDFRWIASSGLNAVRIPVGHWIFGDVEPYVGAIDVLDWAMDQAAQNGVKVVIDLHAAPGSQNGNDHSGLVGAVRWHDEPANIDRSLEIVEQLARRYAPSPALYGIEVLNEPNRDIPKQILTAYYGACYKSIRNRADINASVIISDAFQPEDWISQMNGAEYTNLALDLHLYQCFGQKDKNMSLRQHMRKVEKDWAKLVGKVQRHKPAIIGEWSLALDPKTYSSMDEVKIANAKRAYGQAQLDVFDGAAGWFYWTYKTESASDWNLRYCVENGLIAI